MTRAAGALLCACAVLLSACGNPLEGGAGGGPDDEIVIGASNVGESLLLAHIYAGALRGAGAEDVSVRPPVGGREVVVRALRDDSFSLVAEYSGNLLRYFEPDSTASRPDEVYAQLRQVLPPDLEVLRKAPAQDKDVLVVTRQTARAKDLSSIADLAPYCQDFVFGGPGQWAERWKATIEQLYGCEFARIRTTDVGGPVTVEALRDGDVQVADLFSTQPTVEANDFVALTDPKNMFPAQNIVPLLSAGALTRHQRRALNAVSAVLTTRKLTELNERFSVDKRNPRQIAERFLREHALT